MENSHFGKLSAELRNAIYEASFGDRMLSRHDPAIINVCRQTRRESLLLYYDHVFQVVLKAKDIAAFIKRLSRCNVEARESIKELHIVAAVDTTRKNGESRTSRWHYLADELIATWGLRPDNIQWAVAQADGSIRDPMRVSMARFRYGDRLPFEEKLEEALDRRMSETYRYVLSHQDQQDNMLSKAVRGLAYRLWPRTS
ncbi:hypothetical protein LTS10_005173 [Elasticomyces elasticus]|nr:hypothetical protein LTS10_005173 [Elasticomyces elasticus]